jgi:hypothetical protein
LVIEHPWQLSVQLEPQQIPSGEHVVALHWLVAVHALPSAFFAWHIPFVPVQNAVETQSESMLQFMRHALAEHT